MIQRWRGRDAHSVEPDPTPAGPGDASEVLERELARAGERLRARGLPVPEPAGKLLRPRLALLLAPPASRSQLGPAFWAGALAVQMAHEASLLHDDILDRAALRRGRPTVFAREGVAGALVRGDRLLTASYRAAASTGSPAFLETFVEAVDDTVAGEVAQARGAGRTLTPEEYREIVAGKSGALFGAAFTLVPLLAARGDSGTARALGVRAGALYQMVDDLLDYCPALDRGKPGLGDFRQRKWTHVLEGVDDPFGIDEPRILPTLLGNAPGGGSFLRRGLERIDAEARALYEDLRDLLGPRPELAEELRGWLARARAGVEAQEAEEATGARPAPAAAVAARARSLGTPDDWADVFARHSRSFRFASLFFPAEARRRITGIYVYCRFTDDLVDEAIGLSPRALEARMEAWRGLSRRAHRSGDTGVPLLDRVLGDAGRRGVPFRHVDQLLDGVSMDIEPRRYPDLAALRRYTYGVASTVGGWVAETLGVDGPDALERAYALGHAMQLTNILRDVGEDLRAGRLYLPRDRMRAHGVDGSALVRAAVDGTPAPVGLPELLEELMAVADTDYRRGLEGLKHLPFYARAPVAVAARVYRGIHREIRRNDYDVLGRRAHTSGGRKLWLALGALRDPLRGRHRQAIRDGGRLGRSPLPALSMQEEME